MALTGYVGVPITVNVVMAALIHENHVVTFSSPDGAFAQQLTFVSGGTLTFANGNWNTAQHLVVTPLQSGRITIPYVVTSAYTAKTIKGTVVLDVSTIPADTWLIVPNQDDGSTLFGANVFGVGEAPLPVAKIVVSAPAIGSSISFIATSGFSNGTFYVLRPDGTTLLSGAVSNAVACIFTPDVAGQHFVYIKHHDEWSAAPASGSINFRNHAGTTTLTVSSTRIGLTIILATDQGGGDYGQYATSDGVTVGVPVSGTVSGSFFSGMAGIRMRQTGSAYGDSVDFSGISTVGSCTAVATSDSDILLSYTITLNSGSSDKIEFRLNPTFDLIDTSGAPRPSGTFNTWDSFTALGFSGVSRPLIASFVHHP